MRKRILIDYTKPYVTARPAPNNMVRVGHKYHLFDRVRRRYMSDEIEWDTYMSKIDRIFKNRYREAIKQRKQEINRILGDVYVVIPNYPEQQIGDILLIIKSLQDEPTDVIAVEICKQLNL